MTRTFATSRFRVGWRSRDPIASHPWSDRQESNQRAPGLQQAALPAGLPDLESRAGFEPTNSGFAGRRLEPLGHRLRSWRRVRGSNPRVRLRHVTGFQDRSLPARPTLLTWRKEEELNPRGAFQPNLALAGQCLTTRPPFRRTWSPWRESNPQPAVYKTAALPVEPQGLRKKSTTDQFGPV